MIGNERDPNGRMPQESGAKLDAGKPAVFQGLLSYFPRACLAVSDVSTKGAAKYSWRGWESVPDGFNRYSDALARHLVSEHLEENDRDLGVLHAAQVAWNAMARLELKLREKECFDARQTCEAIERTSADVVNNPSSQSWTIKHQP